MLNIGYPRFKGIYAPQQLASDFLDRLSKRVQSGLLEKTSPKLNNYQITSKTLVHMNVRSASFRTSINIGLNDVDIDLDYSGGSIPIVFYHATFHKWAKYVIIKGFLLGAFIAACRYYFFPDYFQELLIQLPKVFRENYADVVFWGIVVFFGLVWPRILIIMHRKPASKVIRKILEQVNQ